ncbi:MAG: glycoside hydrolase family 2 protein [Ignavibacteriales bacterium]|nr:glycoside hydrolase family 2 protein [Ignavibacteriales bacterium]
MRKSFTISLLSIILFITFFPQVSAQDLRQQLIDFDWSFHLGDLMGASNPGYDDSNWRKLNLPHDWSVEGEFGYDNASGTGYLPGGIGWYRKEFVLSDNLKDKQFIIQFDGVYENSEVWINGNYLGKRPFGFISFYYDLTPYLKFGEKENIIAVRVDNSNVADSRWYTGSGIYRHVWLFTKNKIHIQNWGTAVTTPKINENSADVRIVSSVANNADQNTNLKLLSKIIDEAGNIISKGTSEIKFQPDTEYEFDQTIEVSNPKLWSIENPYQYTLVNELYDGTLLLDKEEIKFGIRSFQFDAVKGFFLNGENLKIKGVCLHNDAGALGSAVPEREWRRRLELMKEMGANGIRTSHNPPSPELLDLCDEMGFIVMDEAFDEWEVGKKKWIKGRNVGFDKGASGVEMYYSQRGYSDFFTEWAKRDIQDMVRRDRNHPSIILWSIGNEIDYPNDPYSDPSRDNYKPWRPPAYKLTEIARNLSDYIKEIDTTRPVTAALANIPLSNEIGYSAVLDVVGYNYQEKFYANDRKEFPDRKMIGSENGDALEAWLAVRDNDYMPGQFLWTGIDYLGEAGEFPNRSNAAGLVDINDFKKPIFYYRQSLWTDKPMVYIASIDPEKQ